MKVPPTNDKLSSEDEIRNYSERYRFPYNDYKIVGDTANIDKIIHTCGYINIDVSDIISILSTETLNYVTVGAGDNITDALEQSVDSLPISTNNVKRMLFQILTPNGHKPVIKPLTEFMSRFVADIYLTWGIAYDESLADIIKVILIASSK